MADIEEEKEIRIRAIRERFSSQRADLKRRVDKDKPTYLEAGLAILDKYEKLELAKYGIYE